MEREVSRELERLFRNYERVLSEIRSATSDDKRLAAWHKVQILGWELNALLPTTSRAV